MKPLSWIGSDVKCAVRTVTKISTIAKWFAVPDDRSRQVCAECVAIDKKELERLMRYEPRILTVHIESEGAGIHSVEVEASPTANVTGHRTV